jgi:hypothetical protein
VFVRDKHGVVSFCFDKFRFILFYFVPLRFVSFRSVSFRFSKFRFVSFRFAFHFAFYRYSIMCPYGRHRQMGSIC